MQMKIAMNINAADGTPMEYEIYNTINRVPGYKPRPTTAPTAAAAARQPTAAAK
jgi:hypothetical protein